MCILGDDCHVYVPLLSLDVPLSSFGFLYVLFMSCHVPVTWYPVPGTKYWYQAPGYLVPSTEYLVLSLATGTWYQEHGTWYQVPCTYQVPSARYQLYLVPGTWFQELGSRYRVPDTRYLVASN